MNGYVSSGRLWCSTLVIKRRPNTARALLQHVDATLGATEPGGKRDGGRMPREVWAGPAGGEVVL